MSPPRPKKPLDRRAVVEGARRAIHEPDPAIADLVEEIRRQLLDPPPDSFTDGVRAERHLRENVCPSGGNPYGPYIEPSPKPENTVTMGGKGVYVLFQVYMVDWFGRQSPETLAALDAMARRQIRRAIFRQILRENWVRASAAAAFVFGAVKWGVEAVEWLGTHVPALKNALQAIRHGGGS